MIGVLAAERLERRHGRAAEATERSRTCATYDLLVHTSRKYRTVRGRHMRSRAAMATRGHVQTGNAAASTVCVASSVLV